MVEVREAAPVETAATAPVKTKKPRSDKGKPKTSTLASNIIRTASTWQSHTAETRAVVVARMSPDELKSAAAFAHSVVDSVRREARTRLQDMEKLVDE